MPESEHRTIKGHFRELSREHCIELLHTAPIGRIAFAGEHHIEILPVDFVYRDDAILFRTAPYGSLAALAPGVDGVAFEVDYHDDQNQSGWSVVLSGRIQAVHSETELAELWAQKRPSPWAAGTRTLYLRLTPTSITGRSVKRATP